MEGRGILTVTGNPPHQHQHVHPLPHQQQQQRRMSAPAVERTTKVARVRSKNSDDQAAVLTRHRLKSRRSNSGRRKPQDTISENLLQQDGAVNSEVFGNSTDWAPVSGHNYNTPLLPHLRQQQMTQAQYPSEPHLTPSTQHIVTEILSGGLELGDLLDDYYGEEDEDDYDSEGSLSVRGNSPDQQHSKFRQRSESLPGSFVFDLCGPESQNAERNQIINAHLQRQFQPLPEPSLSLSQQQQQYLLQRQKQQQQNQLQQQQQQQPSLQLQQQQQQQQQKQQSQPITPRRTSTTDDKGLDALYQSILSLDDESSPPIPLQRQPQQFSSSSNDYSLSSRTVDNVGSAHPPLSARSSIPTCSSPPLHQPRPPARQLSSDSTDYGIKQSDKAPKSYALLIEEAIRASPSGTVLVSDIYAYIRTNYAYFRNEHAPKNWQNSVRHNLSRNSQFTRIPRKTIGKGDYWAFASTATAASTDVGAEPRLSGNGSGSSSSSLPSAVVHIKSEPFDLTEKMRQYQELQRELIEAGVLDPKLAAMSLSNPGSRHSRDFSDDKSLAQLSTPSFSWTDIDDQPETTTQPMTTNDTLPIAAIVNDLRSESPLREPLQDYLEDILNESVL